MKRILYVFILLSLLAVTAGCGSNSKKNEDKNKKQIWYLSGEEEGLEHAPYEGEAETDEQYLDEFLVLIRQVPEKSEYRPLIDDDVRILSFSVSGGILTLNFSSEYQKMDRIREVLARAGIVRTFVQLDGVNGVRFQIEGQEAVTPDGNLIGTMNADSFVEDAGKQINAIQHVSINLYFTNAAGDKLTREARYIYYTASKPLEWAIVERIIAGPKVAGNYPTVPANTQIISVTSANGTCYVNLNQTFLTNALNVDEQIPIYSIVNSLIDDCHEISQVQISVEGESGIVFKQTMDLSQPYEADYTLVEPAPAEE